MKNLIVIVLSALLLVSGCASLSPEEKVEIGRVAITAGMTVVEMILANGEPDMVAPIFLRNGDEGMRRRYQYGDTIAITRDGVVVDVYKAGDEE